MFFFFSIFGPFKSSVKCRASRVGFEIGNELFVEFVTFHWISLPAIDEENSVFQFLSGLRVADACQRRLFCVLISGLSFIVLTKNKFGLLSVIRAATHYFMIECLRCDSRFEVTVLLGNKGTNLDNGLDVQILIYRHNAITKTSRRY